MTSELNHIDLFEVKEVYAQGKNITEHLRKKLGVTSNTSEIIEIAYDLQSGSYTEHANTSRDRVQAYASELASMLSDHVPDGGSILDVGTGELTTLTLMVNEMTSPISQALALDISWSRLRKGNAFWEKNNSNTDVSVKSFVADMKFIPLMSKSVDVVTSSHALEPNGENLPNLLVELFRVAKHKLVLFEPSYELNSDAGQARMDRLGYIKDIEGTVKRLGGNVLQTIPLKNVENPLNPTVCYVIEPPIQTEIPDRPQPIFSVPGTDMPLIQNDGFLTSDDTGLVFPVLENVPILKRQYGILATAMFDE